MKKTLLALTLLLLVIVPVALNGLLLPAGKQKKQLEAEKESLLSELSDLNNQIDAAGALSTIQREAGRIGMKPGKIQRLTPPPVALAPKP